VGEANAADGADAAAVKRGISNTIAFYVPGPDAN
jgi:hypothetical protein